MLIRMVRTFSIVDSRIAGCDNITCSGKINHISRSSITIRKQEYSQVFYFRLFLCSKFIIISFFGRSRRFCCYFRFDNDFHFGSLAIQIRVIPPVVRILEIVRTGHRRASEGECP